LHGGQAADLPGQLRVEIAAGIVRHARQMYDRVDAGQVEFARVAHIALDHGQIRMRFEEIAKPHDVERDDLMASLEQFRNKNAALVTTCAGEKDLHVTMPIARLC
jgi:hypothetical protein